MNENGTSANGSPNFYLLPSSLLKSGDFEARLFSNLYTQTKSFNSEGKLEEDHTRTTYFTEFFQFTYGINDRLNVGMDFTFKSVYQDLGKGSPLKVFQFENNMMAQTTLTSFGPKIRFVPFKKIPRLAVQSTLFFPLGSDLEGSESGRPFLDYDRLYSWTQFYFDRFIADEWQIFTGLDLWFRTDYSFVSKSMVFTTPLKLIVNYFPHHSFVAYGLAEYAPTYGSNFISYEYFQAGVGAKYFIGNNFEIEALVSDFLLGSSTGAGSTYNLGLRYIFN